MLSEPISPTTDLAFKKLFASEEHRNIIQHFLADILGVEATINDIHIRNPYNIHSYLEQRAKAEIEVATEMVMRATYRDVTMSVIDVGDITIEMQLLAPDYLMQRLHYYLDSLFVSNYNNNVPREQVKYSSLKPVQSLNILGFNMFEGDDRALRTFTYHDTATLAQLESTPFKQISFLELNKPNAAKPVSAWQNFIKSGQPQPDDPSYLQEAGKILSYQNLHPEERAVIDAETKARDTAQAILSRARNEGRDEGRYEGRDEALILVVKKSLSKGLEPSLIASITDMDITVIEKLAISN